MTRAILAYISGCITTAIISGSIFAFAIGGIKSAEYNANSVIFKGQRLGLSEQMISVVKEGEDAFRNYMPVRAVLEAMGYKVDWEVNTNSVLVDSNYIITADSDVGDGRTFRDALLDEYNIDIVAFYNDEKYSRFINGVSPEVLPFMIVDDYISWTNGKNAVFPEIYEAMSE